MSALKVEPDCQYGFTQAQVEQITAERLEAFNRWMRGQTVAICGTDPSEPCAGGHGVVVYAVDIHNWLAGGDPLD